MNKLREQIEFTLNKFGYGETALTKVMQLIESDKQQALLNYATQLRQEFVKRDLSSDVMPEGARKMTNEELIAYTLSQLQTKGGQS